MTCSKSVPISGYFVRVLKILWTNQILKWDAYLKTFQRVQTFKIRPDQPIKSLYVIVSLWTYDYLNVICKNELIKWAPTPSWIYKLVYVSL